MIYGRNSVTEALRGSREVAKLLVLSQATGSVKKIVAMAQDRKIPVHYSDRASLDRIAEGQPHQGVIAYVSPVPNHTVDEMISLAGERQEDPLLVLLDGIEDPHNLGAIIRSAECAGAHGLVIPKRRASYITETAVKASAGAVEYLPCGSVGNLAETIESLKKKGVWVAALDMGGDSVFKRDMTGPIAVVIGGEGTGVGKLVRERCDFVVSIPMKGKINSLNASNAAAVVLYEVRRQRDEKNSGAT